MLDLNKLTKQIADSSKQFFTSQINQLALAVQAWQSLVVDSNFKTDLQRAKLPWSVPGWEGDLAQIKQLNPILLNYTVVASDGSQIYPDRHAGTSCYLINTGVVTLCYNQQSSASFSNQPYFFTNTSKLEGNVADGVDCLRHELELADGITAISKLYASGARDLVYLADGSLIAWHLEGVYDDLAAKSLANYLKQLQYFYQQKVPFLGYISLPNSKDLINLAKAKICNFDASFKVADDSLNSVVDADFLAQILQPWQMTIWFRSQCSAVDGWPNELWPYFSYLHTGDEVARLEVPAWVVQQPSLLEFVLQVVIDQVQKGHGYPIALAEAHQQAVIKSPEKEFFYQTLRQFSREWGGSKMLISRKSRQKQIMGI